MPALAYVSRMTTTGMTSEVNGVTINAILSGTEVIQKTNDMNSQGGAQMASRHGARQFARRDFCVCRFSCRSFLPAILSVAPSAP